MHKRRGSFSLRRGIAFHQALGEELQNDDTWDNMLALWKDTLVLDYYHPAVHYPNRVNYYALMAICDVARKKYGTPVWSEQNEKY